MKIAILEDEPQAAKTLSGYIEKFFAARGENVNLRIYNDAFTLLEEYRSDMDVLFMDIQMNLMNGMEAATRIRRQDPRVLIVFVTNLAQYAVNGYEVAAFDFMVKPVTYFDFRMKFDRVINCLNSRKKREVWVASRQGKRLVSEKRLKYVEIMRHTLVYHTLDGNVTGTGTLKSVTEIFSSPSFALCNQCYFVNLAFVTEINGNFVYVDGDALAISAPKKKEFLRALNTFLASGGGR